MRARLPFAAALAVLPALAGLALAHSDGETAPADGATVPALEGVALRFDDPMRVTAAALAGKGCGIPLASKQGTDPETDRACERNGVLS